MARRRSGRPQALPRSNLPAAERSSGGLPIGPINSARDAADVMSDVMNAVVSGQITPADASEISRVVSEA